VFATGRRLIWARRQGPRAKASRMCHLSDRAGALSDRHLAQPGLCLIVTWLSQVSVRSCRGSVRSSLGSARSLSDRAGALSDRHLAQPGLCPIVSGLCPIVTWLSQISVRSCRVSVRSSFGSVWSWSDRVGSLFDHHFALSLSSCGVSLARFIL
jgi:hypothetical protein